MNKINEATFFFLFKSEKKTDEGHLKQMREGLRNNYFFLFGLSRGYFRRGQATKIPLVRS